MSHRPLILITNDDGIKSPGLHAAAQAVADLGDLLIVAPSTQQTGAGRSYSNRADKTIHPLDIPLNGSSHRAYAANVSPATPLGIVSNVRLLSAISAALANCGVRSGSISSPGQAP